MCRYSAAKRGCECVVQECGVPRSDVFVQPAGGTNSAGTHPAGTEAKTAPEPEEHEKVGRFTQGVGRLPWRRFERIAEPLKGAGAKAGRSEPSVVMPNCPKPLFQAQSHCPAVHVVWPSEQVDTSTVQWYKHRTGHRGKWLVLLQFNGSSLNPFLGTTFGNILNKTANLRMPSQGLTI
jgi:hypothetical protein